MTTRLHVYQIETTNACNLRCSFCPTWQTWNTRPKGLLALDTLERVDWSGTSYTELQLGGEPTIHPQLEQIIDWLHSHSVKVGFSTNATFPERLERVIDKVDILTVNDDEFRTNRTFDGRANVFVQHLGTDYPILDYSRTTLAPHYPLCTTPFEYVSVLWNGDVVPCCMDQSGINVFGNVRRDRWDAIEFGPARRNFLRRLVEGEPTGICEYCTAPDPHTIHKRLLDRLALRQTLRDELAPFGKYEREQAKAT